MEFHRIVREQDQLERFIEWLPELHPNECFYLCLQARKKYAPTLVGADRAQLRRFVATKESLLAKVLQLQCPVGAYRTRRGEVIPDGALALYITLNPRCLRRAAYATAHTMLNRLQRQETQDSIRLNPHSAALTEVHKAKSRTTLAHFDVDSVSGDAVVDANAPKCELSVAEVYRRAVELVGKNAVTLIETRGGCHLLVEPAVVESDQRDWHQRLTRELNVDQVGDMLLPVVGCCQGGFTPRFFVAE